MKPYISMRKMRKDWAYAPDGIVTEKRVWSGRKNSIARPTVRFIVDGEVFEVASTLGQNPPLRIGKKVGVYYNPDNPSEEVIINTFAQKGTPMLLIGLIFFLVGAALLNIGIQTLF